VSGTDQVCGCSMIPNVPENIYSGVKSLSSPKTVVQTEGGRLLQVIYRLNLHGADLLEISSKHIPDSDLQITHCGTESRPLTFFLKGSLAFQRVPSSPKLHSEPHFACGGLLSSLNPNAPLGCCARSNRNLTRHAMWSANFPTRSSILGFWEVPESFNILRNCLSPLERYRGLRKC
jgi:hypothetical protein